MTAPKLIAAADVVAEFFTDERGRELVSEGLVYKLARGGELPCVRLGSRVLFNRDEVASFIKEGGCRSKSGARAAERNGRRASTNTTTSSKSPGGRAKGQLARAVAEELRQSSGPAAPTTSPLRLVAPPEES